MKLLLVFAVVGLSGCASWNNFQTAVAVNGANLADEELQSSLWGVCEAVTMGAWQRKFGANPEKAKGWAVLCSRTATSPMLGPILPPQ